MQKVPARLSINWLMHGPTLASTKVTLKPKSLNFSQRAKFAKLGRGVVKWSACSPSTPAIQVRMPLKSTIFQNFFVEKNIPGLGHF